MHTGPHILMHIYAYTHKYMYTGFNGYTGWLWSVSAYTNVNYKMDSQ